MTGPASLIRDLATILRGWGSVRLRVGTMQATGQWDETELVEMTAHGAVPMRHRTILTLAAWWIDPVTGASALVPGATVLVGDPAVAHQVTEVVIDRGAGDGTVLRLTVRRV